MDLIDCFQELSKEEGILQDDLPYLCLSMLLSEAVKRQMISVNRRSFLSNIHSGGLREGHRIKKICAGSSLMQTSGSRTPSEMILLEPLNKVCLVRAPGEPEASGTSSDPP